MATRSSRVMKMLPGCRSACTKPSSKIIFNITRNPIAASRFGSDGVCRKFRILVPSMNSMVSTRAEHSPSMSAGNVTSRSSLKFSAKRRLLRASMVKSSCMLMPRPNSSTLSTGASRLIDGSSARRCAKPRMTFRSNATRSSRFGRRTLTATTRPSLSRALCTCATDADAIGTGEISANSSSGGLPNSSMNVRCTCS